MKNIYVDGLSLVEGHFSGIGQYTLGILQGLDELIENDKLAGRDHPEVSVIIPRDCVSKFRSFGLRHIACRRFPMSFQKMSARWYAGKLPPVDIWCGRGLYVFPRFVDMPLLFSESIVVIHDLSYEVAGQYAEEASNRFLRERVPPSIQRASKVVAVSDNTKREIMKFYGTPAGKIMISGPAAGRYFYRRSAEEIDEAKEKYGITAKNYILALSNLEPRKNLATLVEAYCRLPAAYRKDTSLLIVGVSGWKTEDLFKDILARVGQGFDIVRPSHYVTDKDKPAIMSGASMLVYPSHYEGFGMPPLEALACGVPVITSDNSSLPEVVGNAGRMVPSDDPQELSAGIKDYLEHAEGLKDEVSRSGPEQSRKFSWASSARTYYDTAMQGSLS